METKQTEIPFPNEPDRVLINFPMRRTDGELAAMHEAKASARRPRRNVERFAFRWGLNRVPPVVIYKPKQNDAA
jgi:hypothetical protein